MSEPNEIHCTCGGSGFHVHASTLRLTSDLVVSGDRLVHVGFTVEPATPWTWRVLRHLTFMSKLYKRPTPTPGDAGGGGG